MRELVPVQMSPLHDASSTAAAPDHDSISIKVEPDEDWDNMLITRLTDQPRSVGVMKDFVGASSLYPLVRAASQARVVEGQRLHFSRRKEFWNEPTVRHHSLFAYLQLI